MALSSQDKYLVGDVIGARAMLGFEDLHPCSILADCEGLILAVRIEDVLEFDKSLKTRLLSYCLALSSVALTANPGYREAW